MDKETIDYIINVLRLGTVTWSVRTQCINRGRIQKQIGFYKNGNPKFKYYYYCEECNAEYDAPEFLEVDHIIEIGPFNGNFHDYILRMYCSLDNLQALCSVCHQRKTSNFNSTLRLVRKEKKIFLEEDLSWMDL